MPLPAGNIAEIRSDGSDTLNGGCFDPTNASMATNLSVSSANTASPVATSATYSFVAGDVGHYLFIKSGTNSRPGWYPIVSVAAGAATLGAAIGQGELLGPPIRPTTALGCGSAASLTNCTWAIDYSRSAAAAFSLTGLTTSAANAILLTAAATVAMVGNGLVITGGTNLTAGYYTISSVSAGVSLTLDRTCATAAASAGTAGIGGALASVGAYGALFVTGNRLFIRPGNYTITSTTANVSGGRVSISTGSASRDRPALVIGYNAVRGDSIAAASRPVIVFGSGVSSATIWTTTLAGTVIYFHNLIFDGGSNTSSSGLQATGNPGHLRLHNCLLRNFTNSAIRNGGGLSLRNCEITGCTSSVAVMQQTSHLHIDGCYFWNNFQHVNAGTGAPLQADYTIFGTSTVTGSSGGTFIGDGVLGFVRNCIFYGSTTHGLWIGVNSGTILIPPVVDCIFVSNGGYGLSPSGSSELEHDCNCAFFGNTSGAVSPTPTHAGTNRITLTANPFVDAANGDFRLNDTAGGGALLRAAGYPSAFPGLPLTANFADVGAVQASPSRSGWGL